MISPLQGAVVTTSAASEVAVQTIFKFLFVLASAAAMCVYRDRMGIEVCVIK